MNSYRWTKRLFPPLVLAAVVGSVWYAASHRLDATTPVATASAPSTPLNSAPAVTPVAPPAATLPVPTVQKLNGKVHISVNTATVAHVQKVEFYISNKLVGAAYSKPYSLTVAENELQPGSHVVTAKVYTPETSSQTPPASFISQAGLAATHTGPASRDTSESQSLATTPTTPETPPNAPSSSVAPATPTNALATASADGSNVHISWQEGTGGSSATASYQVWRDGTLLASGITTTAYSDTSVAVNNTYDYTVVAVDANGASSAASNLAPVTVVATGSNQNSAQTSPQSTTPDSSASTQ